MIIKGNIYWAKLDPSRPAPGFDKTDPKQAQWSFDLSIDKKTKDELLALGLPKNSIRNKGDDRGDFYSFRRKAFKKNGKPNQPIRVVNSKAPPNNKWDGKLIGNGSEVNVSYTVNEVPGFQGGKNYLKLSPMAVQIWNLVEFERTNEFPTKDEVSVDNEGETWE